jgi:hypothetical protein
MSGQISENASMVLSRFSTTHAASEIDANAIAQTSEASVINR